MRPPPGERAQATVEFALLLPLVLLTLAVLAQVALVVRDQVHLTRATSAAARSVMVDPTDEVARRTLATVGAGLDIDTVSLAGSRAPGSLVTVRTSARPRTVPLIGLALGGFRVTERLVVRIEGT